MGGRYAVKGRRQGVCGKGDLRREFGVGDGFKPGLTGGGYCALFIYLSGG